MWNDKKMSSYGGGSTKLSNYHSKWHESNLKIQIIEVLLSLNLSTQLEIIPCTLQSLSFCAITLCKCLLMQVLKTKPKAKFWLELNAKDRKTNTCLSPEIGNEIFAALFLLFHDWYSSWPVKMPKISFNRNRINIL